jgi:hypothetical protein
MAKHRSIKEVRLGGKTRGLRFRAHELALLEERLQKVGVDKTVPEILESQKVGMVFLREAIMVGVAHEFVGKKGKEARLSAQKVGLWLDECGEDGNDDFDVLVTSVVEAVVLGLPGAAKAMEEDKREREAREAEEAGEAGPTDNPLTDTETESGSGSTGTNLSSLPARTG